VGALGVQHACIISSCSSSSSSIVSNSTCVAIAASDYSIIIECTIVQEAESASRSYAQNMSCKLQQTSRCPNWRSSHDLRAALALGALSRSHFHSTRLYPPAVAHRMSSLRARDAATESQLLKQRSV
jgi:hypothetical protein